MVQLSLLHLEFLPQFLSDNCPVSLPLGLFLQQLPGLFFSLASLLRTFLLFLQRSSIQRTILSFRASTAFTAALCLTSLFERSALLLVRTPYLFFLGLSSARTFSCLRDSKDTRL